LDTPYVRENNSLKQCSWQIAIEKLKNLFNKSQKEVSLVNSSKNTYQSLTIKIQMASPDEVIDIYKKVGQFDDVIIL
jgi:putative lipoic acid-binding regulatory protein